MAKNNNNSQFISALLTGTNQIKSGSIRTWENVKATGSTLKNKNGHLLIQVIDPSAKYESRWLNLSSFTGQICFKNSQVEIWKNGNLIDTFINESPQDNGHYLELVKNYFNMNDKQFKTFLGKASKKAIDQLVIICQQETCTV